MLLLSLRVLSDIVYSFNFVSRRVISDIDYCICLIWYFIIKGFITTHGYVVLPNTMFPGT